MTEKGYIINNTDRTVHYLKKTVTPGAKVDLEYARSILQKKLPSNAKFIKWLEKEHLPFGFDLVVLEKPPVNKEELMAVPVVTSVPVNLQDLGTAEVGSLPKEAVKRVPNAPRKSPEHFSYSMIRKMNSKQLADLRLSDNPKRILDNVDSIPKLRRVITILKQKKGKTTLMFLVKARIKHLMRVG